MDALGHANPILVKALTEQAGKLWHVSNMFKIAGQETLAKKYTDTCFADVVFFTNSGTEAIEGALKTARKYHSANGHPNASTLSASNGSFHGRSYAARSTRRAMRAISKASARRCRASSTRRSAISTR